MTNRPIPMPRPPHKRGNARSVAAAGLLMLWCLAALLVAAPLQAQSVATVRPNPAQLELQQGQTAALEIRLENARDLYGIDVRLAFDPALLEIIDADPNQPGVQMTPGAFPKPELVALNAADNAAGTARYVITQLNPTPPATGSGVVLTVQVRALAAGQAELAVPLVEMSDRDGNLLAVNTGSSAIEVRANPAAATGIAIQPPTGGGSGDSAAPTAPPATDAPPAAPTIAPPENPPPPGATAPGATAPGATPIAPEATAEVPVVENEPSGTGAGPSGAVVAEEEATSQAVVVEEEAGETAAPQQDVAASAIGAAVSSLQAGQAPEETAPNDPANAPQVIGSSADPAAVAPEGEVQAAESTNERPSPALIFTVVAVLVLAALVLVFVRARGRRTTGPAE